MHPVRAYWYRRVPNFGDQLTEWLLSRAGIPIEWSPPTTARLFGVGSVAHQIPKGFDGTVWGTGSLLAGGFHLTDAHVLALRGPLTGVAPFYADPALLIERPDVPVIHELGVISHYIERLPHDGHRINIGAGPDRVIAEIASCERVVSSSLHGLIAADALGVPNLWVFEPRVIGGGWKFRDYAASFGETIRPDVWRLAPQDQVSDKRAALTETIEALRCLSV
jgi:hypothetical protein